MKNQPMEICGFWVAKSGAEGIYTTYAKWEIVIPAGTTILLTRNKSKKSKEDSMPAFHLKMYPQEKQNSVGAAPEKGPFAGPKITPKITPKSLPPAAITDEDW